MTIDTKLAHELEQAVNDIVTCGLCNRTAIYRATLRCCHTLSGLLCDRHYAEARRDIERELGSPRPHRCTRCGARIPHGIRFDDLYDVARL